MLKWVQDSADHKPDFDLDGVKTGDVVTLEVSSDPAFRRQVNFYTVTVGSTGTVSFAEKQLKRGTYYARAKVGNGSWQTSGAFAVS